MRKDMERVIINTARRGSRFASGIKTRMRIRNVPEPTVHFVHWEYDEVEYFDIDSPARVGRRHRHYDRWGSKSIGDRTTPLYRLLEKSIGRSWNRVWSDICAKTSPGSILGYHLRDHVKSYVDLFDNEARSYANFFVDANGILRKRPRAKIEVTFGEVNKIEISEIFHLELRNSIWFEVHYQKYPKGTPRYKSPFDDRVVLWEKDHFSEIFSRQLNHREIKVVQTVLDKAKRSEKKITFRDPIVLHVQATNNYGHKFSTELFISGNFRLAFKNTLA